MVNECLTVIIIHITSKLDALSFNENRNNRKNNENFPTKCPSDLNLIQKTEELSREHTQKLEDIRRGKVVPDKLEPVSIPPLTCAHLKFETFADSANRYR